MNLQNSVSELETVEPKTEEKTVKEFLEAILSAARDCVEKANHSEALCPELPALRVFYRQDIIGLETVSKGITCVTNNSCNDEAVRGIQDTVTILCKHMFVISTDV